MSTVVAGLYQLPLLNFRKFAQSIVICGGAHICATTLLAADNASTVPKTKLRILRTLQPYAACELSFYLKVLMKH
jgi:hypothetical protein